uniref:Calmin n=1 Tax=Sparus aurata TaxID=8175 RepID=A0A671VFP9_SPAAU
RKLNENARRGQRGLTKEINERKAAQTRTFTRWMNVFLQRRDPPVAVHDLFTDIQDGRILMALLEELSGCKLLYRFRSSSHRLFRLNNISKALSFLDDRHVKLLGIDASGIADGVPSVVLNLIWNIILYFQVKAATRGLQRHLSCSLSSLSMSSYPSSTDLSPLPNDIGSFSCSTLPSKGRKAARKPKYHGKAIKTLLQWVQRCTSKFGVDMHDFGKSWRSGLAFLAMIKSINPALVDLRESMHREPSENLQLAFSIAHHSLDIAPLLEPEDVSCTTPDEQSIITYVSMFLRHCSGIDEVSISVVAFSSGVKSGSRGILKPPSPLDATVVSQDIRSWLEKASADQSYSKPRVDESRFSLSSEEGIYSLSALDSDEEEAYSYILDLNKEVCQPYNQPKRQVPRVEEETAEEMFLNGQQTDESKHLEVFEMLNSNGCKHRDGSLAQHVESDGGIMTLYLLGSIALTHPLFPHSNSGCKASESDALVFYLPSSRAEGFGAPSPAASCVVTPSELETLLLLWILLYFQLPLLHIAPLFLNKKHLLAPFPTK